MKLDLNAEKRNTYKNSELSILRKKGYIPAVLYGPGMEAVPISIIKAKFVEAYKQAYQEVTFYDLHIGTRKYHTILKDFQVHPVNREFLHLDFVVVPRKSHIEIDIPIHFIGEAVGVKVGGVLDVIQRSVKVIALAEKIPEDIKVDINHLGVGDSVHVRDLPEGNWQYKDMPDNTIVVIHARKGENVAHTTGSVVNTNPEI
ncbi:MAG: 50S ribosomal protein L25 [Candidatus Cloacimonetes bacterium]|nr:50S ribosomal protein L25 [Candidatus Cloacimonadota bacterium]